MRVAAWALDPALLRVIREAVAALDGTLERWDSPDPGGIAESYDLIILQSDRQVDIARLRRQGPLADAAILLACPPDTSDPPAAAADADDWFKLPIDAATLRTRCLVILARLARRQRQRERRDRAALLRYEELLRDRATGLSTLPLALEEVREAFERHGRLAILYLHFVWYERIEEAFGWERLDGVLHTSTRAVRRFGAEHLGAATVATVAHVADDDFILLARLPEGEPGDHGLQALCDGLQQEVRAAVAADHGRDLATLSDVFVGAATVHWNPKIRAERILYRGIREAARNARGEEQGDRARRVTDLRTTIREGAVFIEYHPIIVAATGEVYGFEALARGNSIELRSPQILFEVAEEANLVWELSRLLRRRAVSDIADRLRPDQFLFLNVDPHDFEDPSFRGIEPRDIDPERVVLEITERIAIRDYARFQEYVSAFRQRGFRFAVDDAGAGYAGLGSIANLAPDFIKLDMSLISSIDSNFLKQNLVHTLVGFANGQGAKVIAEGVERPEEYETIKQLGVHLTQGFLFHHPMRVHQA